MNKFSSTSLLRLEGVHPYLLDLCFKVLQHWDCTVVYGKRTLSEQQDLFARGLTKTMNSWHLEQEDGFAYAVDLAPYPIDWNDPKRFYYFAGIVNALAKETLPKGYYLRWGGNWDCDEDLNDQTFMDLVHFELRKKDV
jgi:peptidoglycan L-alanyl-D-glutamate endopeptidase CwlK